MIEDGDVLDLGNRVLQVLHTPGHSPGGISLWEASTQTLFSGDILYDGPLIEDAYHSNLEDYARSLARRGLGCLQNNIRCGGLGLDHAGFLMAKRVRSHHGRWPIILPRPALAGGHQIPEPRSGQSQFPEDVHWPRG